MSSRQANLQEDTYFRVMRILDDASDGMIDAYLLGAFQDLLRREPALA